MVYLNEEELKSIDGGNLSGTLINAFVRGVNLIFELGRALGSALQRIKNNKICKL